MIMLMADKDWDAVFTSTNQSLFDSWELLDYDPFSRTCEDLEDSLTVSMSSKMDKPSRKRTHTTSSGAKCAEISFQQSTSQLWVEKYKPKALADLAVNKKKVEEVRLWLESQQLGTSAVGGSKRSVLLLTGPSGAGKTAVVHVLAEVLKLELCEWHAPIPTCWAEHSHHVNTGIPYVSKLQDFDEFLSMAGKFPSLPLKNFTSHQAIHKVLFLDDLPTVHSKEAMSQLCQSLQRFVSSVHFPTIIAITEFVETEDNSKGNSRMTSELVKALENAGATKLTFNPITANAIRKILAKICIAESRTISSETLSLIAGSCEGDIRHAICCLRFLCLGLNSRDSTLDYGEQIVGQVGRKSRKTRDRCMNSTKPNLNISDTPLVQENAALQISSRDGILSLFHALGKLLYNKRQVDMPLESAAGTIANLSLKETLLRHPLKMETPEVILAHAHAEVGVFGAFLLENLPDFIDAEGIEDMANAMAYLSDGDELLSRRGKFWKDSHGAVFDSEDVDPSQVAESVAGSVIARGVLFANTHPAPRRWQSMRAPTFPGSFHVQDDKLGIRSWIESYGQGKIATSNKLALVMDYGPYLKSMNAMLSGKVPSGLSLLDQITDRTHNLSCESYNASEDEIEEW